MHYYNAAFPFKRDWPKERGSLLYLKIQLSSTRMKIIMGRAESTTAILKTRLFALRQNWLSLSLLSRSSYKSDVVLAR